MTPLRVPLTVPFFSHSSDALNIVRWLVSHIALCDEQPRSINTFPSRRDRRKRAHALGRHLLVVRAGDHQRRRLHPPIIALFHPHVVVDGARRTPLPHVAPTGSDASMSAQTTSRTFGSNWFSQPT